MSSNLVPVVYYFIVQPSLGNRDIDYVTNLLNLLLRELILFFLFLLIQIEIA